MMALFLGNYFKLVRRCSTEAESLPAYSGHGFDPGGVGIFNKNTFLPGSRRNDGAEPQSLVSVPNTPGSNLKSLRNAYVLEAYVPLKAIHSLSLAFPLVLVENSRLMPALAYAFTLPHLTFITHTLCSTCTYIHP